MGTKLGPVSVPLKLDLSEVNRQLDQLRTGVPTGSKIQAVKATTPSAISEVSVPSAIQQGTPSESTKREQAKKTFLERVTGAVIKRAGGGLQGNQLAQLGSNVAGQTQEFIPPSTAKALKAAGTAAAVYGIAAETAKVLPEAFALGKLLAGESPSAASGISATNQVEHALEALRQKVVELESNILSIFTAFQKTTQVTKAVERLTGELPNTTAYANMFRTSDAASREVDAKFDMWARKESPFIQARTLIDLFKKSVGQ